MQLKPNQNEDKFKKGDIVCYKGDRSAIATIVRGSMFGTHNLNGLKAEVIWLKGPKMGSKREYDIRDLVMVEEAE